MANNNNNKKLRVPIWVVIPFVLAIITFAIGYLLNIQTGLSARVEDYRIDVQGYKEELTEIDGRLKTIENDIMWIKGFLDPFGEHGSNPFDENYDQSTL